MPPDGTRRSGRILKQIAITLIGSDMEGRVFSERTKTVVLSRHGAGIISSYKLAPEQELVIRSEASHKEIEARVVGQIGADRNTYIYGIAFLDPDANFWDIDFPDLSETEKRASQTLLECSGCHARETADHSDLAADVFAINQSIVRYCQKCGSSTLWRPPLAGSPSASVGLPAGVGLPGAPGLPAAAGSPARSARAAKNVPAEHAGPSGVGPSGEDACDVPTAESSSSPSPGTRVSVKEQENRRKHARTRVSLKVCVRRPGLPDDVVACEDMSRGGLRFKSTRKYFEKTLIDVAVPYSPGDQAIFVPAQIAYVQELPEQKMYRCGVTYLRSRNKSTARENPEPRQANVPSPTLHSPS
jgi:hypothetical protein